jgi:hypothetical protein
MTAYVRDEYTIRLWTMAIALYEETDRSGIPLHARQVPVRDAWREAARKELNKGTVQ